MTSSTALEPRHLKVVERWTLALSGIVAAAGFLFAPRHVALSIAVGAAVMVANAWALRKLAEKVFSRKQGQEPGPAILLFNVKMVALVAIVYVAVKVFGLDAIGFLVGISVFPVAIVIAALRLNLGAGEPDADGNDDGNPDGNPDGKNDHLDDPLPGDR